MARGLPKVIGGSLDGGEVGRREVGELTEDVEQPARRGRRPAGDKAPQDVEVSFPRTQEKSAANCTLVVDLVQDLEDRPPRRLDVVGGGLESGVGPAGGPERR
jgi:hypothetical protein